VKLGFGFIGVIIGTVITLMGLFLIAYVGEERSEGDIYFNFGGSKVDADFVGIPLVAMGLTVLALSLLALRRRGIR